jgi:hypothetical protein
MNPWSLVAAVGGVLCTVGLAVLWAKYRSGDVDRLELVVTVTNYLAVAAIALVSSVRQWHFGGEWLLIIVVGLVEGWRHRHRRGRRRAATSKVTRRTATG